MSLKITKEIVREIFYSYYPELTKNPIVATTHHPYSSPPLRLISSTEILRKISENRSVKILYWDYTLPNEVKFREELSIDTGILSLDKDSQYVFNANALYPLQKPVLPNFDLIRKDFNLVLDNLNNLSKWKKDQRKTIFNTRLDMVLSTYESLDFTQNGTAWSIELLSKQLSLCGFQKASNFLMQCSESILLSNNFQEFVCSAFTSLHNTDFDLFKVMSEVFPGKPVFIGTDKESDYRIFFESNTIKDNLGTVFDLKTILSKFKKYELVPGQALSGLLFYLSGVEEFGKDYGVSDELLLRYENKEKSKVNKRDFVDSIGFKSGITYLIRNGKPLKIECQKPSRLNTINAIYLHTGDNINQIISNALISSPSLEELKIQMSTEYYV